MHQAKLITSRSMQNSNRKVNLNVQFYSTIAKTKNLIIMTTGFYDDETPLSSHNLFSLSPHHVNKIDEVAYNLIP